MRGLKILWPLIVVAVVGVVIVILAEPISKWIAAGRGANSGLIIGRIIMAEGGVRRIHGANIDLIAAPMTSPVELRDGDQIQTSASSKAAVNLNSQDEFEIGQGAAVQFQLWNPKDANSAIYVEPLLGTLELRRAGVRGKAYVVKEGRLYLPGQTPEQKAMALTVLRNAPLDLHLAGTPAAATPEFEADAAPNDENIVMPPNGADPETLSNEYIDEMIVAHQAQLQKCWLSRLKDTPGAKGQIVVQFEISKRGKVKEVRIADSTLKDEVLQKCVMSVIERIPFRPYKGTEISLSYPINFE